MGNIVTGTELIRRKLGGEAFAFTRPLIKKPMVANSVKRKRKYLARPAKDLPYQFYQFWLNATDDDAQGWIKIFTFLTKEEIDSLIALHAQNPADRVLQRKLAEEVTRFVHGQEELDKAIETTAKLFSAQATPLEEMTEDDLQSIEGIVKARFSKDSFQGIDITSFVTDTAIFPSKGEARKMIQNGGLSVNRKKVDSASMTLKNAMLLHGKYLFIQKGKEFLPRSGRIAT